MRNYIRQQWAIVHGIISKDQPSDKDLHEIRKKMKDLFYNMKIYEQQDAAIFLQGKWKPNDPVYFDSLLNELGIFQDYCTALGILKKHCASEFNKCNGKIMKELTKTWKTEKHKLGKLLIGKIRTNLVM